MLKLTLEQVVEGIKALSESDKDELQKFLPELLESSMASRKSGSSQSVNVKLRDVTLSGNQAAFNLQPSIASGDVSNSSVISPKEELIEHLRKLQLLIQSSGELSELERIGAESQIEQAIDEVRKDNPDKSLIGQTISALKQGLKGVQELAGPTASVASIIAKAWGIPAP